MLEVDRFLGLPKNLKDKLFSKNSTFQYLVPSQLTNTEQTQEKGETWDWKSKHIYSTDKSWSREKIIETKNYKSNQIWDTPSLKHPDYDGDKQKMYWDPEHEILTASDQEWN